jgi:manganese oxidase
MHAPTPWARRTRVLAVGLAVVLGTGVVSLQFRSAPSAYSQTTPAPHTRVYFIAADEVRWNYAPAGRNLITGQPFGDAENVFVQQGPNRIGSTYLKALYREYTDSTFTRLKPRPADQAYLGDLGPVIRAEVGDTIRVVFRNNTRFPASIHPHGVLYAKSAEGAPYNDGTAGADKADDAVPPHGTFTYLWLVPERAGPGDMDTSSVMWMYHSHTDEVADTYSGLIGVMEITRRGMARADGSPNDVDREVFTNFMVADENQSPYIDENIALFTGDPASVDKEDEEFQESNLMHSINGYVYGNMPLITTRLGQRVRWYVMGMGTEVDLHTPHWHGNTVLANGMRMDVVQLLPAGMVVANMVPDDPGTWLYHCHVNDHILAGMLTRYQVLS